MIYIVIDTNIYLSMLHERNEHEYKLSNELYGDIISNGIENIEYVHEDKLPKSIIDLAILCENNIVKLIVPEVTLLELEKAKLKFKEDYSFEFKKLKEVIKSQNVWNEINYIKKDLTNIIDTHEKVNIQNWEMGYNNLIKFLESDCTIKVSLDSDIICNLCRKTISGAIKDRQSNDFLFLSSVYKYMKNIYCKDTKLMLVTNDSKDFYKKSTGSDFRELKDELKDDTVNILGLEHINSLYKYINADVNLNKKTQKVHKKLSDYLLDYTYDEEVLNKFNKKNKSFDEIKKIRNETLSDIKTILSNCRKLDNFNDRSELKLYNWLNGRSEDEFDILKLSELLIIRDNLKEYYQLHV